VSEPQGPEAEVSALPESAEAEDAAPADPGLAAERDRLARTLRETRLQLAMTQARLAALEQSATMELGRTLVRAARRPWSRGVQLPADLVRLWRERGGLPGPGAAICKQVLDDFARRARPRAGQPPASSTSERPVISGGWGSPSQSIKARFTQPRGPSRAVKAVATTRVGMTKGIAERARISDLPRKR